MVRRLAHHRQEGMAELEPAAPDDRPRSRQGRNHSRLYGGRPNNPLGARALYIGGTLFRIHGTNNARSIGGAVSSGCIAC